MGLAWYPNEESSIIPQLGDILVSNGGGEGHVAIVKSVSDSEVCTIQQNFSNDLKDANRCLTFTLSNDGKYTVSGFDDNYPIQGWLRKPAMDLSSITLLLLKNSTGTVTSAGQVWMDRNLGASRVATSMTDAEAYGDLYQWGRLTDGHEKRTSPTTTTLSTTDLPGHGSFILITNSPYDWRTPQNDNLWQGVTGINNPCPSGFRLPTDAEWETERLSWSSNDAAGAFSSPLKLVLAGERAAPNGTVYLAGIAGLYASSSIDGFYRRTLWIEADFNTEVLTLFGRGVGVSVRCIKD
jgi:uncharacterized protein (TIGR02145 family)